MKGPTHFFMQSPMLIFYVVAFSDPLAKLQEDEADSKLVVDVPSSSSGITKKVQHFFRVQYFFSLVQSTKTTRIKAGAIAKTKTAWASRCQARPVPEFAKLLVARPRNNSWPKFGRKSSRYSTTMPTPASLDLERPSCEATRSATNLP